VLEYRLVENFDHLIAKLLFRREVLHIFPNMQIRYSRLLSTVALLALLSGIPTRGQDARQDPLADYAKIREAMSKLAPFVGQWNAVALFHDDTTITENDGTWEIRWALEDTYLEFRVAMHRKGDPSHHHGFVTFITFNPRTQQYDVTYFYTRWAGRVTETGIYDEKARQFITKAFIPLEDGVHDENVRTINDLSNPNKIIFTHYSQKSNEPKERLQVVFTLTRQR
jgi:hypothetical protein